MKKIVRKTIKKEIKKTPKIAVLTLILLITLIVSFVGSLVLRNWTLMLFTLFIAIIICLPRVISKWSNIVFPESLEVFIILFLYATLFLGEIKNFYKTYWWWDVLLHTASGLAFGIMGFFILYILYKSERIKTSPKMIAMFVFAFALSMGAFWEIIEFAIDQAFGATMQTGSFYGEPVLSCGLQDTMKDLIDDSVGALIAAVFSYFFIKKETGLVAKATKPAVKDFKEENPHLFKKKG